MKRILAQIFGYRFKGMLSLANIAEGTHEDGITKLSDASIASRFRLVKFGSDADHIALNGENDMPLGVCTDEPGAAEVPADVKFLGQANSTRTMVAIEAIAVNVEVFTANNGKIQNEPTVAGTYYKVGKTLTPAAANNDEIEVESCYPVKFVVV